MEVFNISSHPVLFPSEIASLIKVKKLNENAIMPTQGSEWSAGWDLYACIDEPIIIEPHTTEKIGTGLAMELPNGYFGAIFARSGLATKQGLRPSNCVGVCDADYRNEYIVALHNDSDVERVVTPQERIGQIIIQPYLNVTFCEVDDLTETERGSNGFGSTGK